MNGFVSRAYRDMSRTLHGLSELKNKEALKANAREALQKAMAELKGKRAPPVLNDLVAAFDAWHRRACSNIIDAFAPFHCHYGQAQKWLNMTIKYRWFFAHGNELEKWYAVAHVPVDEYVLRAARKRRVARPAKAEWSRWDKPDDYEAFQKEIRTYAAKHDTTPLAVEHIWWMEEARSRGLQ
jgi:hypothetical protein